MSDHTPNSLVPSNSDDDNVRYVVDEKLHFHPIVARWLEEQDFEYQHELRVEGGIVDFYAKKGDLVWIVECKIEANLIRSAHRQLRGYKKRLPYTSLVIATIQDTITQKHAAYCEDNGITLVGLERPQETLAIRPGDRKTSDKPVSLYPLSFEDALKALLSVPAADIAEAKRKRLKPRLAPDK